MTGHPFIFAAICLVVLWGLLSLLMMKLRLIAFIIGTDRRPSSSKLQFFAWFAVVLFTYLAMWDARGSAGLGPSTRPCAPGATELPTNVLLAMGFSAGTLTLAKGITVNQINNGTSIRRPLTTPTWEPSALFEDDQGMVDLAKLQMLTWTAVAIGLYLFRVVQEINAGHAGQYCPIPDIDTAMMVLMGLGQGAYLAKKAVAPEGAPQSVSARLAVAPAVTPVVAGATIAKATAKGGGDVLDIKGTSFGIRQEKSAVTVHGNVLNAAIPPSQWSEQHIQVPLPIRLDGSVQWPAQGVTIDVGVLVGGVESNRVSVTG